MLKNKMILLIVFLSLYCVDVLSGELVRQPGCWTTKEQILKQGLWNGEKQEPFYGNNSLCSELINIKHQREDWYQETNYIAEFHCTHTNIPFLLPVIVAIQQQKLVSAATILAAGIGSAASHAIPRWWLHHVDTLTALSAIGGVVYDNNLTNPIVLMRAMQDPAIVFPALVAGGAYAADVALAHAPQLKPYRKKWQTRFHMFWHFAAAGALLAFVLWGQR